MKILASILFVIFSFNSAFAHTCVTYSRLSDKEHTEKLQEIDAIFYGEVISIGEPNYNQNEFKYGTHILRIKVLRVWKGIDTDEVSVAYLRAYQPFDKEIGGIGTKKLFYAQKSKDDSNFHVRYCSFTLFDDERMKRELGEEKVIEEPAPLLLPEQSDTTESFWSGIWQRINSFFS